MLKALNTAATGMVAQQTRIDVTANNMANVNTSGFRRARAEFQDLLYQQIRRPGGQTADGGTLPTGVQVGHGVRTASTTHIHQQGSLQQTEGPLDLAIEGSGFFAITRPNGDIAYTRAGNLKTDAQGQLVTVDGYPLDPNITIPTDATSVTITPDGLVSVTTAGQTTSQEVGQLQLANFANPAGLEAVGRSMFVPTTASGEPITATPGQEGLGTIAQGFLEGSNVEVVTEMLDFIKTQGSVPAIQLAHAGRKASMQRPWHGNGAMDETDASRGEVPWDVVAPSAEPVDDGWLMPHAPHRARDRSYHPEVRRRRQALGCGRLRRGRDPRRPRLPDPDLPVAALQQTRRRLWR